MERCRCQRAEYGKQIVATVSRQLQAVYGKGFTKTRMAKNHHNPGAGNEGSKATGVRAKSLASNKRTKNLSRIIRMGIHNLWCDAILPRSGTPGDLHPRLAEW